jgi:HK97 family phage major capsid protein
MAEAVAWGLDYALLRGIGAFQPLGVLKDPALVTVTPESGQVAATIVYDNLTKMYSRLHPALHNGAVWVCNSTAVPQLLGLTVVGGTAATYFPVLREDSGNFYIFGKLVLFTEKLPSVGTKGDIIFANFSQYTLGLRKEISLDRSAHVGFATDEAAFRVILRADGQGRWSKPLTPANGETLSWCVALAART